MTELLPAAPLLLAYLGASLALTLTPGPAVLFIVARTVAHGRAAGLASVAGVALGNFGNALGAALGLAVLFALSSAAFTGVKLAGAAYLVWMGLNLWREAGRAGAAGSAPLPVGPRHSHARVLRDGFVVALLNPKTALFFAAFLPQFISQPEHAMAQNLLLGALFAVLAAATDVGYVLLASSLAPRLHGAAGARQWGQRAAGTAFIGLGLLTAFSGRPGK